MIYKYAVSLSPFMIMLPKVARVLCVQVQRGDPCIWVLVPDPDLGVPCFARWFHVAGTGHSLPERVGDYHGSFQLYGGDLVFHLFDLPGAPDELNAETAE